MLITLIGEPTAIQTHVSKQACKEHVKTYVDGSKAAEFGQKNEERAYSIVRLLDGQAYLAPQGSAMDCCLKGDLILEVGKTAYVWQVKSSINGAETHFKKKATFNGRRYPTPGVIVVEPNKPGSFTWRLDILLQISRETGLPVCNAVVQAVNGFNKARGKTIPLGKVPALDAIYTSEVVATMTLLGLASLKQGSTLVIH